MGRPPMPAGTARSAYVTVRLSERERVALKAEAKRRGVSVSELLMRPWRPPDDQPASGRKKHHVTA